jgi:hypothetical protein
MAWYWSRLSTLAFLALLYASPLSSGDKGLWLTVTSMPVPLSGAVPGWMPPEHSILLPNRDGTVLARSCFERGETALSPGLLDARPTALGVTWTAVRHLPAGSPLDTICPATTAPRGPPA